MFILEFLPHWIFYVFVLIGVIGLFVSFTFSKIIPITYKVSLEFLSIAIFTIGVFMIGAISNEAVWQLKVKEMEAEIAKRELAAAEITTQVVTKYVDRVQIVKGKTNVIIKKVPEYITKESDAKCVINNGFVKLLDASAKNEVPESTGTTNDTPTNIKLSGVAESVTRNYGTYYEISEQLKSLQDWVRQQKELDNGK